MVPSGCLQSAVECNGTRELDCENKQVEQMRKQVIVIRRYRMEGPSLIG